MNGIQEVSGSIPLISTKNREVIEISRFFLFPEEKAVRMSFAEINWISTDFDKNNDALPEIGAFSKNFSKILDNIYIYMIGCTKTAKRCGIRTLRVTEIEKELMWKLYQNYGVIKTVAEKVGRSTGTVSRYVHEYEARYTRRELY